MKVLIVDDQKVNRTLPSVLLKQKGCEVLEAESGEEALALLAEESVDAILLDVSMPGISGTDLCRPEPHEVDWLATWQLVQALTARGAVQDIFLDWSLQPALIAAAHRSSAPAAQIDRQIQHPIRGRATLIKHAAGHVHHMHVRCRCPAGAADCVATP